MSVAERRASGVGQQAFWALPTKKHARPGHRGHAAAFV